MLREKIKQLQEEITARIKTAGDLLSLEKMRIEYLGRKEGKLTHILKTLKDLSVEERRHIGPLAQKLKQELEKLIEVKRKQLTTNSQSLTSSFDPTRPGEKVALGHEHLFSSFEKEIRDIFLSLNFSVVEGPEIENEYYNFDALNIPKDHPARDAWNTFWLRSNQKSQISNLKSQKLLLRTHTSPMQIRYMEKHQPPFQIVVPGTVYRYEATDATHDFQFRQLEGLMVGENISLANLKYVIEVFLKKLFGSDISFEFRPSYYPFVEPGLDVYMKWQGKLLEVAGAGMVHPKVFKAVGYAPNKWQGFAFGFGINRLIMIKYNIPDIRLFHSGDLRFISQF